MWQCLADAVDADRVDSREPVAGRGIQPDQRPITDNRTSVRSPAGLCWEVPRVVRELIRHVDV